MTTYSSFHELVRLRFTYVTACTAQCYLRVPSGNAKFEKNLLTLAFMRCPLAYKKTPNELRANETTGNSIFFLFFFCDRDDPRKCGLVVSFFLAFTHYIADCE